MATSVTETGGSSAPARDADSRPRAGAGRSARELAVPIAAFALVLYLSFSGGGYDAVVYGRVGVAVWWIVLLGVLAGAFSIDRLPRAARTGIALLACFALWTGLSMIWSESAARSAQELSRAGTYLGVFVLAAVAQRHGSLRLTLGAVAAAIGVVASVSLLSRMQPEWFPENETIDLLFAAESRLNYPLNYWNGLAALLAIGGPLLIHLSAHARSAWSRGLASAALPVIGLALYLTLSRGGWLAFGAAVAVLLVLDRRRSRLLGPIAIFALGSAALIAAAEARAEFMVGLRVGEGLAQGDQLLALAVVVCLLAFAARLGLDRLSLRRSGAPGRRGRPALSRRARTLIVVSSLCVVVVAAVAAGVGGRIESGFDEFRDAPVSRDGARLDSASGNGRYQWWSSAFRAFESEPVLGIGSGTYELWWLRDGDLPSRVVNAHSLFAETLGELGIVGFVLVVAAIGGIVLICCAIALRAPPARRSLLAAATAAGAAFAVACATDWAWEMPVVPISFAIVTGAALGAIPGRVELGRGRAWLPLAAIAAVGLVAVGVPLLGTDAIRSSQQQVRGGDLEAALADAKRAGMVNPYSGPAKLQEALVLESMGRLEPALRRVRDAVDAEPTNWQNWLILARIESENAHSRRAIEAFRRAGDLHPSSVLLRTGDGARG